MAPRRHRPNPRRQQPLLVRRRAPLGHRPARIARHRAPHGRAGRRALGLPLMVGGVLVLVLLIVLFTRIRLVLPLLLLALVLWGLYLAWKWVDRQQDQAQQASRQQQNHLNTVFYQLVQRHQGRISVLDFAMTAKIDAAEARAFLDQKAQDFFANFEPTDNGDVLYVFSTVGSGGR